MLVFVIKFKRLEVKVTENKTGEIIIYQADDGQTKIDVRFEEETVWLTQAQLVELYQSSKANISEHIKHIFEEGELDESSTVRNFRTVQKEGNRQVAREQIFYNLDMIISLGYRVKSIVATISHKQAVDKALEEYRKYQVKTLSPVEKAYLETIKSIEKKAKNK
ncbi:virulence RhuM family protein [bacterium]|nr:virulence RhuM family protein [bacterium]